MSLSTDQIQTLVSLVVTTEPDQISCDECFGKIGEFAELSLAGNELPEGMKLIQQHLEQCPCCRAEYEALLEALGELDTEPRAI